MAMSSDLRSVADSVAASARHAGGMSDDRMLTLLPLVARSESAFFGSALAATLAREDAEEERAGLSPHDRLTCPVHCRWIHECMSSPSHAIRVTGHRWCRGCDIALTIAVDELTGSVRPRCPICHRFPATAANRQVVRCCRASSLAARQDRLPTSAVPLQGRVA